MSELFHAPAPGKVNLSLRILHRRDDGFHELRTRLCPISLCDDISLEPLAAGGVSLACDDPTLPTGEENLAIKAVRAYEAASGHAVHARISIKKRIPSGAGMGGGSSDAATVLHLLNQSDGSTLNIDALAEIAATIGSDVPFFLFGQTCDASGRGELIAPVDFPIQLPLLLIKPPFGISTPWAYSRWQASAENPAFSYAPQSLSPTSPHLPPPTSPLNPPSAHIELVNDLERPVFEKYPVLGDLKRWLSEQDGVAAALLSGSGATVFAVLDEATDGAQIATNARTEFGPTFWTQLAHTATPQRMPTC